MEQEEEDSLLPSREDKRDSEQVVDKANAATKDEGDHQQTSLSRHSAFSTASSAAIAPQSAVGDDDAKRCNPIITKGAMTTGVMAKEPTGQNERETEAGATAAAATPGVGIPTQQQSSSQRAVAPAITTAGASGTAADSTALAVREVHSTTPSDQQQVETVNGTSRCGGIQEGEEEAAPLRVKSMSPPKPPLPPAIKAASTSTSAIENFREVLVRFYSVHNPGKLNGLDSILERYAGKEELLVERLESKYSTDLAHARRAAVKASAEDATVNASIKRGASRVSSVGDLTGLALGQTSPQQHRDHDLHLQQQQQQQQQQRQQFRQTHPRFSTSGSTSATPSLVHGSSTKHSTSALGAGANASSSYMTYLADQIRSNVEGLLPASNAVGSMSGSGGGGGGGGLVPGTGDTFHSGSYLPPAAAMAGAQKHMASGLDGAAPAAVATRGLGGGGGGTTTSAGNKTMGRSSSGSGSGIRHQHVGGGSDQVLVARVRALEEERGGLLAACRRMQAKADAAAREVAATEELHEAGQRKMAGFAERTAAAERQTREVAALLRTLESGQAALKSENEASERRCAAKHAQLLSAIDLQMALRSQLEALLEVVPLPPPPASASEVLGVQLRPDESGGGRRGGGSGADLSAGVQLRRAGAGSGEEGPVLASLTTPAQAQAEDGQEALAGGDGACIKEPGVSRENVDDRGSFGDVVVSGGEDGRRNRIRESVEDEGGGGKGENGSLDEAKRLRSVLETSLRASRREALEARRARDVAESTVRQQREDLARLQKRVVDLEASLAREQEACKGASQVATGLEKELELRLDHLRRAESELSDQMEANSRLKEGLRAASARLATASAARSALVDFCQQERTSVERLAAEHCVRAEESAGMRGEEGLARGLELARLAEELGDKRAAELRLEVDRLGKALFASRARLAGSEARAQGLRRELERAAETIVDLRGSRDNDANGGDATVPAGAAGEGLGGDDGDGGEGARAEGIPTPAGVLEGSARTVAAAAARPTAVAAAAPQRRGSRRGRKTPDEGPGFLREEGASLMRNRKEVDATNTGTTGVGEKAHEGGRTPKKRASSRTARGSSSAEKSMISPPVAVSLSSADDAINAIGAFNVE